MLNWNEQFVVGHSLIDREHRTLIDLVNKAAEAAAPSDDHAMVTVLTTILDHTEAHFRHEEQIMSHFSYPFVHKHQTAHQELLRLIGTMIRDASNRAALLRTLDLTASALTDHMRGYDGLFSTYLKDHGYFGVI